MVATCAVGEFHVVAVPCCGVKALEDAEAIANVEKLTGSEIAVFGKNDVRVELAKPDVNEDKPSEDKKSRGSRRKPDQTSVEAAKKPRRERRAKSDDRHEARSNSRRQDVDDEPVPAGEWNGPRPGFLDVGAG